ncbi:MAG: 50S ribosomal protein L3 [Candidatus Aerophobetes bacterium]|nr:50S ribosomal protein L3 [Candidatus Aerophobetes bacterium]
MIKMILGKKIGMTQLFDKDLLVPVTIVAAGPCRVAQKKTEKKDGYNAIQLGFGEIKEDYTTKPLVGHFKKKGIPPQRYLREVRTDDIDQIKIGEEIKVSIFKEGYLVDVSGISKGKGFAGVMKRHNFKGGPASHGAKQWHRRPGSIGASSDPSRVFKGKKMPGRMGGEKITVHNLRVIKVNEKKNLLLIKGALPGKNGDLLTIKEVKKTLAGKN